MTYKPEENITISYSTFISALADAAREGAIAERNHIASKLQDFVDRARTAHTNQHFIVGLDSALLLIEETMTEKEVA